MSRFMIEIHPVFRKRTFLFSGLLPVLLEGTSVDNKSFAKDGLAMSNCSQCGWMRTSSRKKLSPENQQARLRDVMDVVTCVVLVGLSTLTLFHSSSPPSYTFISIFIHFVDVSHASLLPSLPLLVLGVWADQLLDPWMGTHII
jgi:hypothetical protein